MAWEDDLVALSRADQLTQFTDVWDAARDVEKKIRQVDCGMLMAEAFATGGWTDPTLAELQTDMEVELATLAATFITKIKVIGTP